MNTRRRALAGLKDVPVTVAKARRTKKKIELGGPGGRQARMTKTTTAAVAVSTTYRPRRSTSAVVSVAVRLSSRIQSRGVDVAPRLLVPTRTKTTLARLVRTLRLSRKHPYSPSPRNTVYCAEIVNVIPISKASATRKAAERDTKQTRTAKKQHGEPFAMSRPCREVSNDLHALLETP